ncbi:hypothetical protein MESS4_210072 [Mesorhizobium sp. STM 4661]|nr:hypothetical protein MESS4_210072 [Mesorhizobium sp. STM 4661]
MELLRQLAKDSAG